MDFIAAIEGLLVEPARCGSTHLIAIDGRAGAGKTTLSNELFLAFSIHRAVNVIHLDEVYAGWQLALGESLTQTLSRLLKDLSAEVSHQLPIYNWKTKSFESHRMIYPCDLLIIEGGGSAQAIVREYSTATIWLDIDSSTGLKRVLDRDGLAIEQEMHQWQIDEDKLFLADRTRENADFILSTI